MPYLSLLRSTLGFLLCQTLFGLTLAVPQELNGNKPANPLQSFPVPENIPNVWGGNASAPPGGVLRGCSGWLFGFSGLDGTTSELDNFVALVEGDTSSEFTFRFCGLDSARKLRVISPTNGSQDIDVATNDVIYYKGRKSNLLITFAARNIMIGSGVKDVELEDSTSSNGCSVSTAKSGDGTVALCTEKMDSLSSLLSYALVYSKNMTVEDVVGMAKKSLALNVESVATARLAQYNVKFLPSVRSGREKLRNKAISIMRVNSLSAEGFIKQRWSTPDRMPHRWMWLWDSCFHSIAMNLLGSIPKPQPGGNKINVFLDGVSVSWEYLKSVLDAAASDGGIAIQRTPSNAGKAVDQTQPPLLSWSVWENYKAALKTCQKSSFDEEACRAKAVDRLEYAFPRLEGYLRWDIRERSDPSQASPLMSWIKGTESGMDNSQRFDANVTSPGNVRSMLAVDFSTFFALDSARLALIAKEIGNQSASKAWSAISSNMSSAIYELLWDKERKLYMDRHAGGNFEADTARTTPVFSTVKSVASFLPMLLDDFPAAERMPAMLEALASPKLFNSTIAIPSVSLDTNEFSTDMWRGPMWINTNYFVYLGLRKYGALEQAKSVLGATLDCVQNWYSRTGVFFEFYDAKGQEDPRTLLRKGARTGGVRDYHWTAALVLKMLEEEEEIMAHRR